jgi:PilZ domain
MLTDGGFDDDAAVESRGEPLAAGADTTPPDTRALTLAERVDAMMREDQDDDADDARGADAAADPSDLAEVLSRPIDVRGVSVIPKAALSAIQGYDGRPPDLTARSVPPGVEARPSRKSIPLDVQITGASFPFSGPSEVVTRDLSKTGMFLVTDQALAVGGQLDLLVHLPGMEPLSVVELALEARVVRRADHGYGVEFVGLSDDATTLITRLVDG